MAVRLFLALACIFALGVVAVGAIAMPPRDARAACTTNPRPSGTQAGNWHAAILSDPPAGPGGVYAKIENYDPYLYPSSSLNFSVAYVMLTRNDQPYWAQVGWAKRPVGRNTFVQVLGPGVFVDNWSFSPYPVGSYIYYTVLKDNVPGKFTFWANNGLLPLSISATFTPNRGEISGEINNKASQMPGGTSDAQGFFEMKIWHSGQWNDFQGIMSDHGATLGGTDPANGSMAYYNGTQGYIWDPLCS